MLLLIIVCIILLIAITFISRSRQVSEQFDATASIVANMNETEVRRSQFASALLLYDPRVMKYQDPRAYDFHTCGSATQNWKADFLKHLRGIADSVVEQTLSFKQVAILFDKSNLIGNVVFIPLEGDFMQPQEINDRVFLNKYVVWKPPSNIISAIVPSGYKLRFDFKMDDQQVTSQYINDGITKSFVIAQPIKGVFIHRIAK